MIQLTTGKPSDGMTYRVQRRVARSWRDEFVTPSWSAAHDYAASLDGRVRVRAERVTGAPQRRGRFS